MVNSVQPSVAPIDGAPLQSPSAPCEGELPVSRNEAGPEETLETPIAEGDDEVSEEEMAALASAAPDEMEAPLPDTQKVDPSDPRFEGIDDPRIPPGKLFFKIGEVARITGLKPYVLRYWETEFPWIRPSKTSSRQRLYRRQDIAVLLQIKRLRYEERQTIAHTKDLIREHRGLEKGSGRRSSRPPKRPSKDHQDHSRADGASMSAQRIGYAVPAADLAPMLADMRRAVLDLLEAVED